MTAFVQYGFNTVFEYIIERDETTLGGNICNGLCLETYVSRYR